MPIPTPFHERTAPLCTSWAWKDWAGYRAVRRYGASHLPEYFAFREACGLLDVSPLHKYEVKGPDAARLLTRMMSREVSKLKVGRVAYGCWCDEDGKVIDDGTVSRLDEQHFRLTAAEPTLRWLSMIGRDLKVELEDSSARLAALALQGPTSRGVLKDCSDLDVDGMKFFATAAGRLGEVEVRVSRTGYTGDLGYEIWCEAEDALKVWDALVDAGRGHGLKPAGLDALDVARVEAGFIMAGVDYFSAPHVTVASRRSSPFELGLGWCTQVERAPFLGQEALRREKQEGSKWALVGVEASWDELEALYAQYGLPPALSPEASRAGVPLYDGDLQIGQVTSSTWSPILKKWIGLAHVRADHAEPGAEIQVEHTVEYQRRLVTGWVRETPFFDPPRKRATFGRNDELRSSGKAQ